MGTHCLQVRAMGLLATLDPGMTEVDEKGRRRSKNAIELQTAAGKVQIDLQAEQRRSGGDEKVGSPTRLPYTHI
jgi:hypothetical protein